jgi:hypothetical protein
MFAAVVMGVLAGGADAEPVKEQWIVVYEGEESKTALDAGSIEISGDLRQARDATFQADGSVYLAYHEYNCRLRQIRTDRLFLNPAQGKPEEARVAEESQKWRPVTENGITSLLLRIVCEK